MSKHFDQAEVDRIVSRRLRKERDRITNLQKQLAYERISRELLVAALHHDAQKPISLTARLRAQSKLIEREGITSVVVEVIGVDPETGGRAVRQVTAHEAVRLMRDDPVHSELFR